MKVRGDTGLGTGGGGATLALAGQWTTAPARGRGAATLATVEVAYARP
jgi:hypothetical protein